MPSIDELRQILNRIDGRSDNAYHEIRGSFNLREFTLFVDHVQGDPFAAPSKLRLRVDQALARLPEELYDDPVRRLAFEDFLTRRVYRAACGCVSLKNAISDAGLRSNSTGWRGPKTARPRRFLE